MVRIFLFLMTLTIGTFAQNQPFEVIPDANPPYYRVHYNASDKPGDLTIPVRYTIWIPPGVKTLRGVIVHQHGCGPWSCNSGLAGAYDLHWQALARKYQCALLSPSYEQPQDVDCLQWCDPRNGSDQSFQKSLDNLGTISGHPELATVPWALWGHSGGGVWVGYMTMLHPGRVAAVWMNSGTPAIEPIKERPEARPIHVSDEALQIPMMCNLGIQEGITVKEGRHAAQWPIIKRFFNIVRGKGGFIGIVVDPLTGHPTGNQRYLAIPWFDACLDARLPVSNGGPIRLMPEVVAWYAPLRGPKASPGSDFSGDKARAVWLPNKAVAKAWEHFIRDTEVPDSTRPPAPFNFKLAGGQLTWDAEADLESGLACFIIERDGEKIATVPDEPGNPLSRPVFQGMVNSDAPLLPLRKMQFEDTLMSPGQIHKYKVFSVNTTGLKSEPAFVENENRQMNK